jgi:hypothetical protein
MAQDEGLKPVKRRTALRQLKLTAIPIWNAGILPTSNMYAGETPAFQLKLTIPLAEADGNACNVALRALGHGTPCPYISPDGGRAATAVPR